MTEGKAVLVTGVTGGIGHALTTALAARGYTVYAAARGELPADLARLPGVRPLRFDLTDPAAVEAAAARVREDRAGNGLHAVVNNAGIIVQGPVELVPADELRRQFEINVYGPMAVTRAFLPLLREGRGRVVNVSAPTARLAMPYNGPISASKAALESFSAAARVELAPFRIPVSIVRPGAVRTAIFGKAETAARKSLAQIDPRVVDLYRPGLDAVERATARTAGAEPGGVVKTLVKAVEARRPKAVYNAGRDARLLLTISRLPVRVRDRVLAGALGLRAAAEAGAGAPGGAPAGDGAR
ncbi:SDR family NAD(P)-dependent oxidoreductase [Actinomadura rugatobispora]|uniref:SDR family NAD(P)-dependent oxidoreductase n=1 Tax=Actinomadura rugatobispora TaxID=1994 RepID=A0ABW1A932_9ACTN|nr:SDR family NAD(P)-dependent oxidoreductase [Actinomadura rugatobispora]